MVRSYIDLAEGPVKCTKHMGIGLSTVPKRRMYLVVRLCVSSSLFSSSGVMSVGSPFITTLMVRSSGKLKVWKFVRFLCNSRNCCTSGVRIVTWPLAVALAVKSAGLKSGSL